VEPGGLVGQLAEMKADVKAHFERVDADVQGIKNSRARLANWVAGSVIATITSTSVLLGVFWRTLFVIWRHVNP
jgi:hypothetical protein